MNESKGAKNSMPSHDRFKSRIRKFTYKKTLDVNIEITERDLKNIKYLLNSYIGDDKMEEGIAIQNE